MRALARGVVMASVLAGCDTGQTWVRLDPHLNRMLAQPKALPYDANNAFPNGVAMQHPPDGAVPIERRAGPPLLIHGIENGTYAAKIPLPVTRETLHTGRQRFDVYCAVCHGVLGDGKSPVADAMQQRKPRSLHDAEVRGYPPGEIFGRISEGYGLMPSYSTQLTIEERWAVVAYVQALWLSRGAKEAELPGDARAALAEVSR